MRGIAIIRALAPELPPMVVSMLEAQAAVRRGERPCPIAATAAMFFERYAPTDIGGWVPVGEASE